MILPKLIRRFFKWIAFLFWYKPIAKPPREKPARIKATEVVKEWIVITYHGQRIPMHQNEYEIWKSLGRLDKRAMKSKFERQEKAGLVKFIEIEGKMVCVKNKDYQAMAETAKASK